MMPLEAIEPTSVAPGFKLKSNEYIEVLLRMLHALTVAKHPYVYLVATEPRPLRSRD